MSQESTLNCYICGGGMESIGFVPFDRNNSNQPIVNDTPVEYHKCNKCHCVLCLDMLTWSPEKLGKEVYNDSYPLFDPDYISTRPANYAKYLTDTIPAIFRSKIRHLDYGSGTGVMSNILKSSKWDSEGYDPFSSPNRPNRKFNFITCIEVLEHSTNSFNTLEDIVSMLDSNGVLMLSTLLSDKSTTIDWWYIGARNGHINIMSKESMLILAKKYHLFFSSLSPNLHIFQRARSNMKNVLGIVV